MKKIRRTVVVITALRVEFQAIRDKLSNVRDVSHKGTIYEQGSYASGAVEWCVIVAEVGVGNVTAAIHTERAISVFSPDFVFFAGVAGGVKNVRLGDVVVASKVCSYETGADGKKFKVRAETQPASYAMVEKAKYLARSDAWRRDLADGPSVHVAGIAAGSKVVKSRRSTTARLLREIYGDVVAVEMEGAGFLKAVDANSAKALVIRGISDLLDKKDVADAAGWQPKASANAAAFLYAMLDLLAKGVEVAPPVYIRVGTATPTLLNAEVKTLEISIRLLDRTGSRATIEKTSTIRAVGSRLQRYIDNIAADGEIDGFESQPGHVEYVISGGQEGYVVLTRFDPPIESGETIERKLSADATGSFTHDQEDWTIAGPYPEQWVQLTVEFPSDRPCKKHQAYAIAGKSKTRADGVVVSTGCTALTWRITSPDPQFEYQLAWEW